MTTNKQYELALEGVTYQAEVEGQTVLVNGRPFTVTVEGNTVQVDGAAIGAVGSENGPHGLGPAGPHEARDAENLTAMGLKRDITDPLAAREPDDA